MLPRAQLPYETAASLTYAVQLKSRPLTSTNPSRSSHNILVDNSKSPWSLQTCPIGRRRHHLCGWVWRSDPNHTTWACRTKPPARHLHHLPQTPSWQPRQHHRHCTRLTRPAQTDKGAPSQTSRPSHGASPCSPDQPPHLNRRRRPQ